MTRKMLVAGFKVPHAGGFDFWNPFIKILSMIQNFSTLLKNGKSYVMITFIVHLQLWFWAHSHFSTIGYIEYIFIFMVDFVAACGAPWPLDSEYWIKKILLKLSNTFIPKKHKKVLKKKWGNPPHLTLMLLEGRFIGWIFYWYKWKCSY